MTNDQPPTSTWDKLILAFALVFPTLMTWIYFVLLEKSPSGWQQAAAGIGKVIQFGLPMVWVVYAQRQPVGWPSTRRDGLLASGILGVVIVAAMVAAFHLWLKPSGAFDGPAALIRSKVAGMGLNSPARYFAVSLFYAAIHSLLEEYYWRWFVFGQLCRVMSLGRAMILSSIGFMAHHVVVLSHFFGWGSFLAIFFSLSVAIGGLLWAKLYHDSKSLYGPWLSHGLVDAGIFAVGYQLLAMAR